jgi:hypothetical protein
MVPDIDSQPARPLWLDRGSYWSEGRYRNAGP